MGSRLGTPILTGEPVAREGLACALKSLAWLLSRWLTRRCGKIASEECRYHSTSDPIERIMASRKRHLKASVPSIKLDDRVPSGLPGVLAAGYLARKETPWNFLCFFEATHRPV